MRKTQKNFLIGCGFALLGLFTALVIVPAQVKTTKNIMDFQPTFFPNFSCYLIVGLSLLLIVRNLWKDKKLLSDLIPNLRASISTEAFVSARNIVIALLMFCVYYFLFQTIGFICSTVIILPALFFFMGWRKPLPAAIITALVIAVLYVFFNYVMLLKLP